MHTQGIGKASLEGRAHEIYELLMANVLSGNAGSSGGGAAAGGHSRVQHDTDRWGCVCVWAGVCVWVCVCV